MAKVLELVKSWEGLEKDSRRPDRCGKPAFMKKKEVLEESLLMPFNLAKKMLRK